MKIGGGGDDFPIWYQVSSNGPQFGVEASEDSLLGYWHYVTCVFDEDCPRIHLFYQSNNEFEQTCKQIKKFVREHLNIDL